MALPTPTYETIGLLNAEFSLSKVYHDATLFGDGTRQRPLKITPTATLVLKEYTVATLPAGELGSTAFVTDANSPTFLGTLTGGGSTVTPVFYNGTSWVAG